MAMAEENQVVEVGWPAAYPVLEVVGLGPVGRPVTTGPGALPVADEQGPTGGAVRFADGVTNVDDGGVGTE